MASAAVNFKRVGVIGNSDKTSCAAAVREAGRLIRQSGRTPCSDGETAGLLSNPSGGPRWKTFPDVKTLARNVDMLLVFGGDGTMLRAARSVAGLRTPMLGVNIGSLGFLTAVPSAELAATLERVWKGEVVFESRTLIEASGCCSGQFKNQPALNDIVVSRGIATRLIELEVRVDGNLLTRYRCDGLIVSSPTGSTAYSLAAGGAVIAPTAAVLALTPICPHTLSNRSLILPLAARIEIKVISEKPATILSADGQVISELAAGDEIAVCRSRRSVRLMHLAGWSFCETLRHKLHWRGGPL